MHRNVDQRGDDKVCDRMGTTRDFAKHIVTYLVHTTKNKRIEKADSKKKNLPPSKIGT